MHLNGNIFDYFIVFFTGVLLSLTPCIYPLIPVTAASIAGANTSGTRSRAFFLSSVYVLGMAVTYSLLAVVAVLTGKVFGAFQQNPWLIAGVGLVFFLFFLVMWDVLPWPSFSFSGRREKPATPGSLFLLGLVSGAIVGPCTAPVLGSLLIYVASRQNLAHALSLIFVFAYGLGMSLILAGTFSGFLSALPKSGIWMVRIKKAAGFVFLGAAGYYWYQAWTLL
jgi:thiol:disulfide interchange protein DsbD